MQGCSGLGSGVAEPLFLLYSLLQWQENISFPVLSGGEVRHGKAEDLREQQPRQPQQHRLLIARAALLELNGCCRDFGTFCKLPGKSRNVSSHCRGMAAVGSFPK